VVDGMAEVVVEGTVVEFGFDEVEEDVDGASRPLRVMERR